MKLPNHRFTFIFLNDQQICTSHQTTSSYPDSKTFVPSKKCERWVKCCKTVFNTWILWRSVFTSSEDRSTYCSFQPFSSPIILINLAGGSLSLYYSVNPRKATQQPLRPRCHELRWIRPANMKSFGQLKKDCPATSSTFKLLLMS